MPLLAAWWIGLFGWRGAFVALTVFVLLLGSAAGLAIKEKTTFKKNALLPGTSLNAALKTREFLLLYLSLVFSCVGLFVPMVHLGPFAQDLGFSEAQGVALVSFIGLGSLIGRFTVGPLADRLGRRLSLAAMYAVLGIMLAVWWGASAYWVLALFAVVFGMAYGGAVALLPTLVMDLYGARAVSGIIGCLYTGAGLGTLVGPWLAGAAYDTLGAYDAPILAGAAFALLAAACVLPLVKSEKTEKLHRG